MTQGNSASGDPAPHSPMASALEEIRPYVLVAGAVALLGTPADVAVPLVRRLRRQSGVSLGPNVMNLINGTVALAVTHHFRRHPAQAQRWKHTPILRWGAVTSLLYLVASPAAAARWKRGVVLRRRSPLWGGFFSPSGLIQSALMLVAVYRARRARPSSAIEPSSRLLALSSPSDDDFD